MAQPPTSCFNRRGFLVATASSPLAGLVGGAQAQPAAASGAAGPAPAVPSTEDGARLWLNNPESDTLAALVDRMIPASSSGPGGVESGVVTYIDRQLAGTFGAASNWYMRGPFADGTPSQGWQLPLTPAAVYRMSLEALGRIVQAEHGRSVAELDDGQRDALLTRMEREPFDLGGLPSTVFFEMLLANVTEGYFADPLYGGNRQGAAWKQIEYPGANPVRTDLVTNKAPFDGDPVSIG
jgi:gluconate 2-dehydrogenase gamma chain